MKSRILIALATLLATSVYAPAYAQESSIPDAIKGYWHGAADLKGNYLAEIAKFFTIDLFIGKNKGIALLALSNEQCFYPLDVSGHNLSSPLLVAKDNSKNCPDNIEFTMTPLDNKKIEVNFPSGIPVKSAEFSLAHAWGELPKRGAEVALPDIIGIKPGMTREEVAVILEDDGYTKRNKIGVENFHKEIEYSSRFFIYPLDKNYSVTSSPDIFMKIIGEDNDRREGPDMWDIISITYSVHEPSEAIAINRWWKPETLLPKQSIHKASQEKYGTPSYINDFHSLWLYDSNGNILEDERGEAKAFRGDGPAIGFNFMTEGRVGQHLVGTTCSIFIQNTYKSEKSYLQGMNRGGKDASDDIFMFTSLIIDAERAWKDNWYIFNHFVEAEYENLLNQASAPVPAGDDADAGPAPRL